MSSTRTGEIIAEAAEPHHKRNFRKDRKSRDKKVDVVVIDEENQFINIIKTLKKDNHALRTGGAYRNLQENEAGRTGDASPGAKNLFKNLFFDHKRYNLGIVGRYKLNKLMGLPQDKNMSTPCPRTTS